MSTPLANRFLNYEVIPPAGAWQLIANKLTVGSEQASLAERLQGYEVPAPNDAWINISAALQTPGVKTRRGRTVPFKTIVLRLSAAAAIGFIFIGCFYYFSTSSFNKNRVNRVAANPVITPVPYKPSLKNLIRQSVPPQSLAILTKAKAVFSGKRKKNFVKEESRILRNAVVNNILYADTILSVMVSTKLIRNENGTVIQNISLLNNGDDKYINVTSPNGEQTKISSKFLHALVYLRDSNYLDNFQGSLDQSFLESLVWKIKFESWRKKLLETPFIPSSYNYLDIFQLKELITKE